MDGLQHFYDVVLTFWIVHVKVRKMGDIQGVRQRRIVHIVVKAAQGHKGGARCGHGQ